MDTYDIFLNKSVISKNFGEGKIKSVKKTKRQIYFKVSFKTDEKDFLYPQAFIAGHLSINDEGALKQAKIDIDKIELKEKQEENIRKLAEKQERDARIEKAKIRIKEVVAAEAAKQRNIREEEKQKQEYAEGIRKVIEDNEVSYLYHFTQKGNLKSILEKGLVPRNKHEAMKIESLVNDQSRFDGDGITNLSVNRLNSFLLKQFKINTQGSEWVVLAINPSILLQPAVTATFCQTNAATSAGKRGCSSAAFADMFAPVVVYTLSNGKARRIERSLDLSKCFTTDEQAEITVTGTIPPEYIERILFQSKEAMDKVLKDFNIKKDNRFHPAPLIFRSGLFAG